MSYRAVIRAKTEIADIPVDNADDAREYIEKYVKTGNFGEIDTIELTPVDSESPLTE